MTSSSQQVMPPPAAGSIPDPVSPGVCASPPSATQTAEPAAKAVIPQDQLQKQTRPIYLMPLNEAGKATNFPYKRLVQPTPARVLEYFSPTLATQLAKNPSRMNLEVSYPREHVDALVRWMKNGGGPWNHQGRFSRRLQEVEDMEAFVGLVKEWGIAELAPHAERELEAAKKRAAPLANTKDASASGKKQALPQKQTHLQKQALLGKVAPKARGDSGRKCFGCGSTGYDIGTLIHDYFSNVLPDISYQRVLSGLAPGAEEVVIGKLTVVGILVKDDFGYRSAILSDDLNPKYVRVSPAGERVFEIAGTVEVSEYGLTSSRKKQERPRTGAQKKDPSGESSVPKAQ
ncbi:hypothetical protein JMJ35_008138 [Cladonia borealis]|uniref:Uncharacterized protein n=1 Tax=Cladonia borealis TaxID=184061 RepID=A0AA39V3C6_9LECA|nr:hypothetical protein JMJ35_008138 [Cladonia borealis]